MTNKPFLLGIDQGTSGSRALLIDDQGQVRGYGYRALPRTYPQPGWVEQDPPTVAETVSAAIAEAIQQAGCHPGEIAGCGIASQRNTDFAWDGVTGQPLANAITWQDLRTVPDLAELAAWPHWSETRWRLGYAPGPYSSALHLAWRMRHDEMLIEAARAGRLRFGLSAAWVLNALGHPDGHWMDASLVQATGLYDFRHGTYWQDWLEHLGVPRSPLPDPVPSVHPFGQLKLPSAAGGTSDVPVFAMIGDQQGALFGYECRRAGDAECTHGTASFVDVCVGHQAPDQEKMNVYYAWVLPGALVAAPPGMPDPVPTYCLEADTAVTGAAIRWMRESARLFDHDSDVGVLAASVPDSGGVVFVPAFTGLNVPYNDHHARGTILGLTLGTTRGHIVRAFLESLGFQLRAILDTIASETGLRVDRLYLGGGVSTSDEACQIQADLLGIPTIRSAFTETTARAAALLAGLGAGVWHTIDDLPPLPAQQIRFAPRLSADQRDTLYARWQRAIARARGWESGD